MRGGIISKLIHMLADGDITIDDLLASAIAGTVLLSIGWLGWSVVLAVWRGLRGIPVGILEKDDPESFEASGRGLGFLVECVTQPIQRYVVRRFGPDVRDNKKTCPGIK